MTSDLSASKEPLSVIVDPNGHGQRLDKWLSAIWPYTRSHLSKVAKTGCLLVDGAPVMGHYLPHVGQRVDFFPPEPPPLPSSQEPLKVEVDQSALGLRLDKWLSTIWPISRADLTKAAKKGCLLVNGTRAKASLMAKDGQKIVFYPPDKPKFPEPPDFVVLYQDEEIFIIDKPAGLIAHPAEAWDGPTLADSLLALDPNLAQVGVPERPGLVHRLDKDTTGVMVVARTPAAYDFLYAAFAERLVSKKYLAFVKGRPQIEGLLETNYGRNPHWRWKMAVLKEGRLAQSFIKVLRHFPEPNVSLVELTLLTGRTHQARVHLAAAKSPVLGDHVYGLKRNDSDEVPPALAPFLGRQLLHARRLSFPHPTGGRVAFRAPWPQDFIGLWRELTASA